MREIVQRDSVMVRYRVYEGLVAREIIKYFYNNDHSENLKKAEAFLDGLSPAPEWWEIVRLKKSRQTLRSSDVATVI